MSSSLMYEEIKMKKTVKALYAAMFSLLKKLSFKKLTIKEICEEAKISRAAFYTHFEDKYDLLKHWITELWPEKTFIGNTFEQRKDAINLHMRENMPVFKNLLYDADFETFGILFDFILSTISLDIDKNSGHTYSKDVVLSNFYAGGIISYLLWQIKHNFPSDVPAMNKHFYDIAHVLQDLR